MKRKASDDQGSPDSTFDHRRFLRSHFDSRLKLLDFLEQELQILKSCLDEYPAGSLDEPIRTVEGAYLDAMFLQLNALTYTLKMYRSSLFYLDLWTADDIADDIPF